MCHPCPRTGVTLVLGPNKRGRDRSGGYLEDDVAQNGGAAYIFEKPAGGWIDTNQENTKLTAGDGAEGDWFGGYNKAVSISGNFMAVAARNGDDACLPAQDPDCNSGSAYVFAIGGDCNHNGTPDACDILDGTNQDINGDGIPDKCDVVIPTVSQWGLVVMALLLLTGLKTKFDRRRSAQT